MIKKLPKFIAFLLCFFLIFEQSGFAQVAAQLDIASHLSRLRNGLTQDKFRPLHLRYLSYDSLSNNFKLLLDKGDVKDPNDTIIEETSKELLNYFFVGLSLPNDSFWVNLRPDSPNNIIDDYLAQTEIGHILLKADLQLKKDTALATSPQTPEGKEYWDKLYKKAEELFGYENVTIPTLTRPWIVPDEILIQESQGSAYIYKATLKVMLEQDYLKDSATYSFSDPRLKELNEYSSQLIRELVIPKITKEINSAKRYAKLRQVYYSLIFAQWFKKQFAGKSGAYLSLIDTRNLNGLVSPESFSKDYYFLEYQKSFKDGEYNIQEPHYTPYGHTIRSYFSGGADLNLSKAKPTELGGDPLFVMQRSPRLVGPIEVPGGDTMNPTAIRNLRHTPSQSAGIEGIFMSNEKAGVYIESQIKVIPNLYIEKTYAEETESQLQAKRKSRLQELLDIHNPNLYVKNGVVFIKIPRLLEATGQFGHIGLWNTYGRTVVYIDSQYAKDATVEGHEFEEISLWQQAVVVRRMQGVTHLSQIRDWMRDNPGDAVKLTEEFHNKANAKFNIDAFAENRGVVIYRYGIEELRSKTPRIPESTFPHKGTNVESIRKIIAYLRQPQNAPKSILIVQSEYSVGWGDMIRDWRIMVASLLKTWPTIKNIMVVSDNKDIFEGIDARIKIISLADYQKVAERQFDLVIDNSRRNGFYENKMSRGYPGRFIIDYDYLLGISIQSRMMFTAMYAIKRTLLDTGLIVANRKRYILKKQVLNNTNVIFLNFLAVTNRDFVKATILQWASTIKLLCDSGNTVAINGGQEGDQESLGLVEEVLEAAQSMGVDKSAVAVKTFASRKGLISFLEEQVQFVVTVDTGIFWVTQEIVGLPTIVVTVGENVVNKADEDGFRVVGGQEFMQSPSVIIGQLKAFQLNIRSDASQLLRETPSIAAQSRSSRLAQIDKVYAELRRDEFGGFPFYSSEAGNFAPAGFDKVVRVFEEIGLSPGQTVLDLGGGDAQVAVIASEFGAKGTAIEFDDYIFSLGSKALKALEGLFEKDRVEYIHSDFFEYKMQENQIDVIWYYEGSGPAKSRIENKILAECRPGTTVILYNYIPQKGGFERLEEVKKIDFGNSIVVIYRIPQNTETTREKSRAAVARNSADGLQTPGGIDFRHLPIISTAIQNLAFKGNEAALLKLSDINLPEEWQQIENLSNADIAPSAERIKEYIQAHCIQDGVEGSLDKVILCIADILRKNEENYAVSDRILRDILIVLVSGLPTSELKRIFIGKKS